MPVEVPKEPKIYTTVYDNFRGVDLTNDDSNVFKRRSPDGMNMVPDVDGRPRKRRGWKVEIPYTSFLEAAESQETGFIPKRIHHFSIGGANYLMFFNSLGVFYTNDKMNGEVVKCQLSSGDALIVDFPPQIDGVDIAADPGRSFFFEGAGEAGFYTFVGGKLFRFDGEYYREVEPYIPTTIIACDRFGFGDTYEGVNILTRERRVQFLCNDLTTAEGENIVIVPGGIKDGTDVTVEILVSTGAWHEIEPDDERFPYEIANGAITFTDRVPYITQRGEDNLRVTYTPAGGFSVIQEHEEGEEETVEVVNTGTKEVTSSGKATGTYSRTRTSTVRYVFDVKETSGVPKIVETIQNLGDWSSWSTKKLDRIDPAKITLSNPTSLRDVLVLPSGGTTNYDAYSSSLTYTPTKAAIDGGTDSGVTTHTDKISDNNRTKKAAEILAYYRANGKLPCRTVTYPTRYSSDVIVLRPILPPPHPDAWNTHPVEIEELGSAVNGSKVTFGVVVRYYGNALLSKACYATFRKGEEDEQEMHIEVDGESRLIKLYYDGADELTNTDIYDEETDEDILLLLFRVEYCTEDDITCYETDTQTELSSRVLECTANYSTYYTYTSVETKESSRLVFDIDYVDGDGEQATEDGSAFAGCERATVYGSGLANQVFLCSSGYPGYGSRMWYSGVERPNYFPDLNYVEVGSNDTSIMGFLKCGEYLGVVKAGSGLDSSVYLAFPTSFDNEATYAVKQDIAGIGAISKGAFNTLSEEPMFLSKQGIVGIELGEENKLRNRSYFLNGELCKEPNLEKAVSYAFDGMYFLCVNNKCYILDGSQKTSWMNEKTNLQFEGYVIDNIPAQCFADMGGSLYFTDFEGNVCRFLTDDDEHPYRDDYSVYDPDIEAASAPVSMRYDKRNLPANAAAGMTIRYNKSWYTITSILGNVVDVVSGVPIKATWATIADDDGAVHFFKNLRKKGCLVSLLPGSDTGVEVYIKADEQEPIYIGEAPGTISGNELPYEFYVKKKFKKYKRLQIICKNDGIDQGFGIDEIIKSYTIGNYSKNRG